MGVGWAPLTWGGEGAPVLGSWPTLSGVGFSSAEATSTAAVLFA